jgi:hypothetical protein
MDHLHVDKSPEAIQPSEREAFERDFTEFLYRSPIRTAIFKFAKRLPFNAELATKINDTEAKIKKTIQEIESMQDAEETLTTEISQVEVNDFKKSNEYEKELINLKSAEELYKTELTSLNSTNLTASFLLVVVTALLTITFTAFRFPLNNTLQSVFVLLIALLGVTSILVVFIALFSFDRFVPDTSTYERYVNYSGIPLRHHMRAIRLVYSIAIFANFAFRLQKKILLSLSRLLAISAFLAFLVLVVFSVWC